MRVEKKSKKQQKTVSRKIFKSITHKVFNKTHFEQNLQKYKCYISIGQNLPSSNKPNYS